MNTMIKRISEVIRKAIDEAPYEVKLLGYKPIKWTIVGANNIRIGEFTDIDLAEAEMDRMNDEWVARKVVECMKGEMPLDVYENYYAPWGWKQLDSVMVWNIWIDAILKE